MIDKYYKLNENNEMNEIKNLTSDTYVGTPDEIARDVKMALSHGISDSGYKLASFGRDLSGTFGEELIKVKQITNPNEFK